MTAIRFLVWALAACNCVRVIAQSSAPLGQPSYGGQMVQGFVPYEQESVFQAAPSPPTPAVFVHPAPDPQIELTLGDPFSNDPYAAGEPVLQQARAENRPERRKSFFQKVFATGTYIPQFDGDSLGFGDLEAGVVFGVPFFRVTAPLLITPRFATHFLDRPAGLDLPSEVYDAELSFRHLRKFGDGPWAMNAAVTLGHYSDFEANDADAFRVTGQAFAVYEWSPTTTWVFGVVYLNREDISIIPAIGFIYEPHPDMKFDAILPRPRISWRLPGGRLGGTNERWLYVGGEFGGGIWSIDRPATVGQDLLTYNDYRLLVGIEKKAGLGSISHRLEFGYVFGRELEFSSATPDVELDDSLFVRLGLSY